MSGVIVRFNWTHHPGRVRSGAGEGGSVRHWCRWTHRYHVYTRIHIGSLRELACCDRGRSRIVEASVCLLSHPAPGHRNTALYYAAIAAAWRNTTPCCGSPGTSHPKIKSDAAVSKDARRSSSRQVGGGERCFGPTQRRGTQHRVVLRRGRSCVAQYNAV